MKMNPKWNQITINLLIYGRLSEYEKARLYEGADPPGDNTVRLEIAEDYSYVLRMNADRYEGVFDGHKVDLFMDAPSDDFVADTFFDTANDVHFTAMSGPVAVQFKLRMGMPQDRAAKADLVENACAKLSDAETL